MTVQWHEFTAEDFEELEVDEDGFVWEASTAPIDEWTCTVCGETIGFYTDDTKDTYSGGWRTVWCPTDQFDEATMRCEDCADEEEVGDV